MNWKTKAAASILRSWRTRAVLGGAAVAANVLAAYFLGAFGPPRHISFHIEYPLRKACMVRGIFKNTEAFRMTNVTIRVRIYIGNNYGEGYLRRTATVLCKGTPNNLYFEFKAVIAEKLDKWESTFWKLTWDDATPETKHRHRFVPARIEEWQIKGPVKVVVDIRCNEGIGRHWEFTYEW